VNAARQAQLDAILVLACRLADHDAASSVSLLVGALTLACGRVGDPAAVLQIAIDSLSGARDLVLAHQMARKVASS